MDLGLEGQVVLVTGGAGGIGTAISRAFASEGAHVALTYHDDRESADALARELTRSGREAMAIAYDMDSYSEAAEVVSQTVSRWKRLDVLIANAVSWPTLPPEQQKFVDVDWQVWSKLVDTNFYGTAAMLQQAARQMLKQGYGRIVVMSTEIALDGMPGATSYSAAKSGIHGLVASLRWELGPRDVFVNFVSPGFNMTPRNLQMFPDEVRRQAAAKAPTGRLSVPKDVAPTVVYLASKANRHITGEFISVSGGAD